MIATIIDYSLYAIFFTVITLSVLKLFTFLSIKRNIARARKGEVDLVPDDLIRDATSWLPVLYTLAQISPFMGLTGTVLRIQLTLVTLTPTSGLIEIAHPVGAALHSTFLGLLCAIPAVFSYGIARSAVVSLQAELAKIGEGADPYWKKENKSEATN